MYGYLGPKIHEINEQIEAKMQGESLDELSAKQPTFKDLARNIRKRTEANRLQGFLEGMRWTTCTVLRLLEENGHPQLGGMRKALEQKEKP